MKRRHLFLVAGILAFTSFIGYLGETKDQELFGFSLNIWVHRIAWLIAGFGFLGYYINLWKQEKAK